MGVVTNNLLQGWDEAEFSHQDCMTLCPVWSSRIPAMYCPKRQAPGPPNWFEGTDLPEVEPFELDENCYSSRDKVGVLLKDPQAHAVLSKYFSWPDAGSVAPMESMTIDAMSKPQKSQPQVWWTR